MYLCFAVPPPSCGSGKPVLDLRLVTCPARLVWRADRRGLSLLPWGVLKARDLLARRHPSWAAREKAKARRGREQALKALLLLLLLLLPSRMQAEELACPLMTRDVKKKTFYFENRSVSLSCTSDASGTVRASFS